MSCTCGHLSCVCAILARHKKTCRFRRAATCAIPIECECPLARDTCPMCDPCTCGARVAVADFNGCEILFERWTLGPSLQLSTQPLAITRSL